MLVMRSIAKDLASRRLLCSLYSTSRSCRSLIATLEDINDVVPLYQTVDFQQRRAEAVDRIPVKQQFAVGSGLSSRYSLLNTSLLCSSSSQHLTCLSFSNSSGRQISQADGQKDSATGSSISAAEVRKFEEMAKDWWDPEGSSAPLHSINPVRTKFARDALCLCFGREPQSAQPLHGLTILDVGCGGGLFSEALARLGASVTGIDASEAAIHVAREHARADPVIHDRTSYRNITAEQALDEGLQFDAVVASEVIEHVENVPEFCRSLSALTRDDGAVVISTINRTAASYAVAIVGAEYLAQVVPKGTHDWSRFITPDELSRLMEGVGLPQGSISGMFLNPVTNRWSLIEDTAVNYISYFKKKSPLPEQQ